jgi:hypothetical protein
MPWNVVLLTDVASVVQTVGENGYLIRDLSPIANGENYFIPGSFLEMHGRKHPLNRKRISEVLGRAYADLVLWTGLQLETPHGQNVLLEVAPDGDLTGRVAFRDLSDTFLAIQRTARFWNMTPELHRLVSGPQNRNVLSPSIVDYALFGEPHLIMEAYMNRLEEAFGLPRTGEDRLSALEHFLGGDEGQRRLDELLSGPGVRQAPSAQSAAD